MNLSASIDKRMRWAKTHNAPSTRKMLFSKYKLIRSFFGDAVTQRKLDAYVSHRVSLGIRPSTINYELDLIRSVVDKEKVRVQRLRDRTVRGRVYLTHDEVMVLLANMEKPMADIATAYLYTGARLMELYAVTAKHLNEPKGFITIPNQKTMASGYDQNRIVPYREEVKGLLPLDKNISPFSFRYALARAAKKANIGIKVTPKTLRATFASTLVQSGVDMVTVARLLGHTDTKITQKHYAHLAPKNLTQAVETLPRWGVLDQSKGSS